MSLTSSIPVLRVADYVKARDFWTGALGFIVVEEAGDPVPGFGILESGAARVFLNAWNGPEAPYDHWRAYFHTTDLDELLARLDAHGAEFSGPRVTDYGMREVEVTDTAGNTVCFAADA